MFPGKNFADLSSFGGLIGSKQDLLLMNAIAGLNSEEGLPEDGMKTFALILLLLSSPKGVQLQFTYVTTYFSLLCKLTLIVECLIPIEREVGIIWKLRFI
jgi:hypothetical protein